MKNFLTALLVTLVLQFPLYAQDFVVNNPVMTPNPGVFPGGTESVTFDFYVSGASYTFSNSPLSNDFATITFSFTKLNPTTVGPSGTGASLFTWVLTNNGGSGAGLVYTWTGSSKTITVNQSPPAAKYKITFANMPITFAATAAQADVRVAAQFTDPGNAPSGQSANNFAVIATYTNSAGLPILLLNFDAVKAGSNVQLNWKTSSEVNSDHFEVEFSKDGTNWQTLGSVAAAGNSSITKSYGYLHATPVSGANYYRLRQYDINGDFVITDTRVVVFNSRAGIKVMPNPVVSTLYITSDVATTFQSVSVFTADGKLLQQNSKVAAGSTIDMNRYAPGTYMIKIVDAQGNTEIHRVVKERL